MKTAAVTLLAATLSGCVSPPEVLPTGAMTAVTLDRSQIKAVHDGVKASMKDPESARFGEILASRNSAGQIAVCGTVNGKNSYGGYTGMLPFAGEFAGALFKSAGIGGLDDIVSLTIRQQCARKGMTI